MAGYTNFQVNRNKRYKNANVFEKGNNRVKQSKSERMMNGVAVWTSFYRENPHRFVKDYLNINLKIFQMILLYAMMHYHTFVFIAARGMGK